MILFDLQKIYRQYFNEPYAVPEGNVSSASSSGNRDMQRKTALGGALFSEAENMYGRPVFLPVRFWKSNQNYFDIPCCTIRITNKKTIIRKAVSERQGTVKEQFSIGDYLFNIKGVLIGENGNFPDREISKLREFYETEDDFELHNALTELFMDKSKRIVISDIDFPEVQGKDISHRPFTLTCESDFVDGLILTEK